MKAGWEVKPLGEVCVLHYGKPLPPEDRNPAGKYAAYGANGEIARSDRSYYDKPSVIIGRKGSAGEIKRVDEPFWPLDVTYFTEHDSEALTFDYLHYLLTSLNLPTLARGVKPGINRNDVYDLPIPLPPLEEQRRIVALLDEAFEGLNRARENTETNLTNGRELFENWLQATIDDKKKNWVEAPLAELYDVRDGTHDSPKYVETGRALITSKNLGENGLHFRKVKFISETDYNHIQQRSAVHQGDVLLAMIGTIGNPTVVDIKPDFAIKNVALFKMLNGRSGHLLRFLLLSRDVRERMLLEAKGTTQKFVGLGYLRKFLLSVPPPQKEAELVDLFTKAERRHRMLENQYQTKLADLEDLRQSLLQKAFAGELT